MEGKETRFGVANSALWPHHHRRLLRGGELHARQLHPWEGCPAGQLDVRRGHLRWCRRGALWILMYAVVAVFLAGLMVGGHRSIWERRSRSTSADGYPGHSHSLRGNVLWVGLTSNLKLPPGSTSQTYGAVQKGEEAGLSAAAKVEPCQQQQPQPYFGATYKQRQQRRPHGFSEILLRLLLHHGQQRLSLRRADRNTPYYNMTLGIEMLIGRFLMIIPLLAMAGASRERSYPGFGWYPGHRYRHLAFLLRPWF